MKLPKTCLLSLALLTSFAPDRALMAADSGRALAPEAALQRLKEGQARYQAGQPAHPDQTLERRRALAGGQKPFAAFLGCADSRVPVELVFDQGLGDLFVVRVAGNTAGVDELGSLEYAVEHLGVSLLVVMGHSKCGAVSAVVQGADLPGNIGPALQYIIPAARQTKAANPDVTGDALIGKTVEANVWEAIHAAFQRSHLLSEQVKAGRLQVVGAVYDLASGGVQWLGRHPEEKQWLEAGSATTASALESDPHGWTDLMPAPDLKDWTRVPVPPTAKLGREQWRVDPVAHFLVCDGDGGHDMLLHTQPFGDAIFHVEFRYTKLEGKADYNSGIYVRNSADGAIWHQAQIGSKSGGWLFGTTLNEGKKRGFNLTKAVKEQRLKEAGEWNTVEVTARGQTLTFWANGGISCEFNECGVPTGLVGLEGEGYRIEFRNLKVKRLEHR